MGENENSGIDYQEEKKKKGGNLPKIIIGIAILALLLLYLVYRFVGNIVASPTSRYETSIVEYYKAVATHDTNKLVELKGEGFVDEIENLPITDAGYDLFSYGLEKVTNNEVETEYLLYSISFINNNEKFSYLAKAFFSLSDTNVKITRLKKVNKGKLINSFNK